MMEQGVFTYACPMPQPQWSPGIAETVTLTPFSFSTCGFTQADRETLQRIEAKLDELLDRTAPEAEAVQKIREKVLRAIGKDGKP
jgi:glutaredoxin